MGAVMTSWPGSAAHADEYHGDAEWRLANGHGGFAACPVAGPTTDHYHGLLITAPPDELGHQVLLNYVEELVRLPDGTLARLGGTGPDQDPYLVDFHLDLDLPVWTYKIRQTVIEKQILMPQDQDTVYLRYLLRSGPGPVRVKLRPGLHHPPHGPAVGHLPRPAARLATCEIGAADQRPALRLALRGPGAGFTAEPGYLDEICYDAGSEWSPDLVKGLWGPGRFCAELLPNEPVTLIASAEPWELLLAVSPDVVWSREIRRRRLANLAPHAEPVLTFLGPRPQRGLATTG